MFLVAAAMVSAWMITVANLPAELVTLLKPLLDQPTLLMIAIMVLTMLVGTAMDMTPTILILTPVLMPLVKAAGIDPVYFGVLFMINNAIGLITPPVGTVLSTVAGVGKMSMDEVTKGVWPFMLAQFAVMFLMVLFPQLVMVPARWFYATDPQLLQLVPETNHETTVPQDPGRRRGPRRLRPRPGADARPSSSPTRTPRAIPSCWAWRSSPSWSTRSPAAS